MHANPVPALSRHRSLPRRAGLAAAAALVLLGLATAARAESIANGPVLLLGYSPDDDASGASQDLAIVNLGWRWRFDGADFLDDTFAKIHADFSWAVEPLVGGVFGDAEAFEASVVPYAHFAPLGWEGVVPWLEGGIGIAYTGLRNYGLGSSVELSDNVGVGVTFGSGEGLHWSIGYRFRHLSHAGIFSEHNDGLNAHFLTITVE